MGHPAGRPHEPTAAAGAVVAAADIPPPHPVVVVVAIGGIVLPVAVLIGVLLVEHTCMARGRNGGASSGRRR